ncbi:hypothetical protein QC760_007197 [Botrytis cinerea]
MTLDMRVSFSRPSRITGVSNFQLIDLITSYILIYNKHRKVTNTESSNSDVPLPFYHCLQNILSALLRSGIAYTRAPCANPPSLECYGEICYVYTATKVHTAIPVFIQYHPPSLKPSDNGNMHASRDRGSASILISIYILAYLHLHRG